MSNQDEDEVEDELEALEQELNDAVTLPDAPKQGVIEAPLPDAPSTEVESEQQRLQKQKERAKARRVALEVS